MLLGCTSNQVKELSRGGAVVSYRQGGDITVRARNLVIHLSPQHALSTSLLDNGAELTLNSHTPGANALPSDYVTAGDKDIQNFVIQYSHIELQDVHTNLGDCMRVKVPSRASDGDLGLERTIDVDLCPSFPQAAVFTATYKNRGSGPLEVNRIVQVSQEIESPSQEPKGIWTFQGASLLWGRDNVFPLPASFRAENPMGEMVAQGYGGGIPVNDYWNGRVGLATGHIEPEPVACWMPVETQVNGGERIYFETRPRATLEPGGTLTSPRSFVAVHRGDFYEGLATYSAMLRAEGVTFLKYSESLYHPIWWTYAFGHNFRPAEVYNSIPKFKEFGIEWLIINNRWWDHYGDWVPRPDKFGGEAGFKEMIARLHQAGLKSLIWWEPCGVQVSEFPRSGLYNDAAGRPKQLPEVEKMVSATADVALRHRDWLIQDQGGKLVPIRRNLAALCPAYPPARDYLVQLARRMIVDWKADGFYMDESFPVPPCYNPAHHHASPYDSMRQLTTLFYEFRKVIEQSDPQGMLMICPCGNTINHCLLPTTNEPVTADPVGSEQIRWRVKMYKALMGPMAPVFADRVESTHFNSRGIEVGRDFPSCMGTGGVIGTIFIWPKIDKLPGDLEYRGELEVLKALVLTPDKDALWKKWFDLYREKMISSGAFLDLYTVGFDVPEGYAIRKDQKMYYAFFTPPTRPWGLDKPPDLPPLKDQAWEGRLELRGLDKSKEYQVVDYEHGRSLGSLKGSSPYLDTKFTNYLVLEVVPKS
jgi:alpha-galactosidase